MAIINTTYSFGWYGTVENDQPFSLRDNIGTFTWDDNVAGNRVYTGAFPDLMKNASGDARDFANGDFGPLKALQIWGYQDGSAKMWSLMDEYHAFITMDMTLPDGTVLKKGDPNRTGFAFDTLQPGRMYWIFSLENYEFDLNIPGFIPSADGVDMGRVVPV